MSTCEMKLYVGSLIRQTLCIFSFPVKLALHACFATVIFSSVKHSEIYCEHHEPFVLNFFSAVLNKKIAFPKMDDCNFIAT